MQLTGFTVLVVEDDVDNLALLSSHLEQEGALVLGAESVKVALRLTLEHDVDALLCNLELPDGDGCGLLRKLRGRPGGSQLPAVAFNGYSDAIQRQAAADCGFNRYEVEPFPLDALTDWLSELIDRETRSIGMSCLAAADPAAPDPRRR